MGVERVKLVGRQIMALSAPEAVGARPLVQLEAPAAAPTPIRAVLQGAPKRPPFPAEVAGGRFEVDLLPHFGFVFVPVRSRRPGDCVPELQPAFPLLPVPQRPEDVTDRCRRLPGAHVRPAPT